MKKSLVKSLILGLMITISIYQVITLWFDNVSDRNFFYSVINKVAQIINEPKNVADKEYMINPRLLGVYLGASDKDFTIVERGGEDYNNILSASTKTIIKVISEGDLESIYEESDFLWENRGLMFSLSMPMTKEALASDFNVNSSIFSNISNVNTLGIIPANDKSNEVKVYFISGDTHEVHVYALSVNELREENTALNTYIEKMTDKGLPAYSTLKNKIELFNQNILLPLPSDSMYYYNKLNFITPYIKDYNFDSSALEKYINGYFDNPNIKWKVQNDDVMIYGDDNALIKYNNNGFLEYSSIKNSQDITQNLSSAFNSAEKFLERDILLLNLDYYLQKYSEQDGKITFYYGYGYDHLPINLENSLLANNNLIYPMEITVEKGKVVKYKRLLIDIENSGSQDVFKGQFETALNQFVDKYKVTSGELEDMYLGYINKENQLKLVWIIKSRGEFYWLDLN